MFLSFKSEYSSTDSRMPFSYFPFHFEWFNAIEDAFKAKCDHALNSRNIIHLYLELFFWTPLWLTREIRYPLKMCYEINRFYALCLCKKQTSFQKKSILKRNKQVFLKDQRQGITFIFIAFWIYTYIFIFDR